MLMVPPVKQQRSKSGQDNAQITIEDVDFRKVTVRFARMTKGFAAHSDI